MAKALSCPRCGYAGVAVEWTAESRTCPGCGHDLQEVAPPPSVLSAPLIANARPAVYRRRSILLENLKYFAVFIPLVGLATAIIFLIIFLVQSVTGK